MVIATVITTIANIITTTAYKNDSDNSHSAVKFISTFIPACLLPLVSLPGVGYTWYVQSRAGDITVHAMPDLVQLALMGRQNWKVSMPH